MGDTYNVSGQAGAVGPKARAKQINLYQGGSVPTEGIDLPQLARELEELRQALKREATTREHDSIVATVGEAAEAAEKGDQPEALGKSRKLGRWALNAATAIGAGVAAAAIKGELGI